MSKKQLQSQDQNQADETVYTEEAAFIGQVNQPILDPQIAAWQAEYNVLAAQHAQSEGLVKGQLGSQMRRLQQKVAQREFELYGTPIPTGLIDKGKPGYQAKSPESEYTEALAMVLSGLEKLAPAARKIGKTAVWAKALGLQAEFAQMLND